jgi:hypothetical protein
VPVIAPVPAPKPLADEVGYAERLKHIYQLIINGKARIGRLMILIAVMTDLGLPMTEAEVMIDLFEGLLRHWNENRLRMLMKVARP